MIFSTTPLASVSLATTRLAGAKLVALDRPVAAPARKPVSRPSADISRGGWLPSKGSSLYAMLNKAETGTAFIRTKTLSTCEISLGAMTVPGNRIRYKAASSLGNSLVFELLSGGEVVASWAHTLSATDDMYSHTLTPAQVAMMAGGNLTARLTATQ